MALTGDAQMIKLNFDRCRRRSLVPVDILRFDRATRKEVQWDAVVSANITMALDDTVYHFGMAELQSFALDGRDDLLESLREPT